MSFIYSQALVAEYLAGSCSDIDAYAQLNESHTLKPSWWHDKTMEPSRHSRFGMTYAPLTESLGAELLMWFVADSLAKTSALQETVPDWTAKGQGYGEKWLGLLGRFDPDSCSLKTVQLSLLEDSTECCPTLPRWGLMLDGELFPQPMLEPFTEEKESGYWPTPNCIGYRSDGELAILSRQLTSHKDFLAMTHRACRSKRERYWPTATATAYKGWSPNHNRASSDDRLDYTVERESFQHGQQTPPMRLNPDWVEWLMGWPIGQTELKPLATDKFREWQRQHSPCFTESREAA